MFVKTEPQLQAFWLWTDIADDIAHDVLYVQAQLAFCRFIIILRWLPFLQHDLRHSEDDIGKLTKLEA